MLRLRWLWGEAPEEKSSRHAHEQDSEAGRKALKRLGPRQTTRAKERRIREKRYCGQWRYCKATEHKTNRDQEYERPWKGSIRRYPK